MAVLKAFDESISPLQSLHKQVPVRKLAPTAITLVGNEAPPASRCSLKDEDLELFAQMTSEELDKKRMMIDGRTVKVITHMSICNCGCRARFHAIRSNLTHLAS